MKIDEEEVNCLSLWEVNAAADPAIWRGPTEAERSCNWLVQALHAKLNKNGASFVFSRKFMVVTAVVKTGSSITYRTVEDCGFKCLKKCFCGRK
jgi:hypothetical protein